MSDPRPTPRPTLSRRLRARLRRWRDRRGAVAIWSVMWLAAFLSLGGVAVDVTNAYRVRNQLQSAADAAALAAAMRLPDEPEARGMALTLAARNLPRTRHGAAMTDSDVTFGTWDPETRVFAAGVEPAQAVLVKARQTEANGNPVPTWLLTIMGKSGWDVEVASIAVARMAPGGGNHSGPEPAVACPGAMIMTRNYLSLGGGNTFHEGVCLHGETGVHAGGNDWFDPDVRVTAANVNNIYIGHVRAGSASGDQVKSADSRPAEVVPLLSGKFNDLWNALWPGSATTYSGDLLPDFVKGPDGTANIVRRNTGWWTMQPSDVQPHTIYLVNHGMGISGDVQLQNAVILAKGQIGIGGGTNLNYRNVMLFGAGALNFSGDIMWGDPDTYCDDGKFGVYLFSLATASLGGWGSNAGMFGAMVAAPNISPGGTLVSSGGLYFEATNRIDNGGNSDIRGCGTALRDHFDFGVGGAEPDPAPPAAMAAVGSFLVR